MMTRHFLLTTILAVTVSTPVWADKNPATGEELAANQAYTYWMLDSAKSLDPDLATSVEDADIIR
jgi:oligopeptide transport system substrate-binding protein